MADRFKNMDFMKKIEIINKELENQAFNNALKKLNYKELDDLWKKVCDRIRVDEEEKLKQSLSLISENMQRFVFSAIVLALEPSAAYKDKDKAQKLIDNTGNPNIEKTFKLFLKNSDDLASNVGFYHALTDLIKYVKDIVTFCADNKKDVTTPTTAVSNQSPQSVASQVSPASSNQGGNNNSPVVQGVNTSGQGMAPKNKNVKVTFRGLRDKNTQKLYCRISISDGMDSNNKPNYLTSNEVDCYYIKMPSKNRNEVVKSRYINIFHNRDYPISDGDIGSYCQAKVKYKGIEYESDIYKISLPKDDANKNPTPTTTGGISKVDKGTVLHTTDGNDQNKTDPVTDENNANGNTPSPGCPNPMEEEPIKSDDLHPTNTTKPTEIPISEPGGVPYTEKDDTTSKEPISIDSDGEETDNADAPADDGTDKWGGVPDEAGSGYAPEDKVGEEYTPDGNDNTEAETISEECIEDITNIYSEPLYRIQYLICPDDQFALNSLELLDRDQFIKRILKENGYKNIIFIEQATKELIGTLQENEQSVLVAKMDYDSSVITKECIDRFNLILFVLDSEEDLRELKSKEKSLHGWNCFYHSEKEKKTDIEAIKRYLSNQKRLIYCKKPSELEISNYLYQKIIFSDPTNYIHSLNVSMVPALSSKVSNDSSFDTIKKIEKNIEGIVSHRTDDSNEGNTINRQVLHPLLIRRLYRMKCSFLGSKLESYIKGNTSESNAAEQIIENGWHTSWLFDGNSPEKAKIAEATTWYYYQKGDVECPVCNRISLYPYPNETDKPIEYEDFQNAFKQSIGGILVIDCQTRFNLLLDESGNNVNQKFQFILNRIGLKDVLSAKRCGIIWLCNDAIKRKIDTYLEFENRLDLSMYETVISFVAKSGEMKNEIKLKKDDFIKLYSEKSYNKESKPIIRLKVKFADSGREAYGTGFIIDEHGHVLTCKHCIMDSDLGMQCTIESVYTKEINGKETTIPIHLSVMYPDGEDDIVLLRIKENIGEDFSYVPLCTREKVADSIGVLSKLFISGYDKDNLDKPFYNEYEVEREKDATSERYRISARRDEGASGSPIFMEIDGETKVVGIYDAEKSMIPIDIFWKNYFK